MDIKNVLENTRKWQRDWVPNKITVQEETQFSTPTEEFFDLLLTEDYISLTDMVHSQMQEHIIFRWMSLKSTIEYIGEWESLNNPSFNHTEFGTIRNAAGRNNFVLSVKTWIEKTNAIGIVAKAGRYGGTYAHKDIAYHFGMWISPRFQLLLVYEYQRLQEEKQKLLGWTANRELSKINYHIHTDAIKPHTHVLQQFKHYVSRTWQLHKFWAFKTG